MRERERERRSGTEKKNKEWNINRFASDYSCGFHVARSARSILFFFSFFFFLFSPVVVFWKEVFVIVVVCVGVQRWNFGFFFFFLFFLRKGKTGSQADL